MAGRLSLVVLTGAVFAALLVAGSSRTSASPDQVYISALSCDSNPEFVW
jgi:hypothetical protein